MKYEIGPHTHQGLDPRCTEDSCWLFPEDTGVHLIELIVYFTDQTKDTFTLDPRRACDWYYRRTHDTHPSLLVIREYVGTRHHQRTEIPLARVKMLEVIVHHNPPAPINPELQRLLDEEEEFERNFPADGAIGNYP